MPFKTGPNSALGVATVLGTPSGIADTTAQVLVNTVVTMVDETQGAGDFIYLPGVAGTVAGDLVVYDLTPGAQSTTRLVNNAQNNTGRPVAVALAATVAGQFGWYQISGVAIVNAVVGTVAGAAFANATTGSISNTADAGDQLIGARVLTAVGTPSAGKAYVALNRPNMQSQIT